MPELRKKLKEILGKEEYNKRNAEYMNQVRACEPLGVAVSRLRTRLFAYRHVPSPPPGTTPAPIEDASTLAEAF